MGILTLYKKKGAIVEIEFKRDNKNPASDCRPGDIFVYGETDRVNIIIHPRQACDGCDNFNKSDNSCEIKYIPAINIVTNYIICLSPIDVGYICDGKLILTKRDRENE